MPFISLPSGATLHYDDENREAEGAPVLLLHGMLGIPRQQLPTVIGFLAEAGYRVIAPNLRGYGLSAPKPRDFPPRFYHRDAQDVLAFCEALGLERVHILGYSDGGEVALVCGGLQPQRFLSVAAWGAVGYFGPDFRAVAQRMIPGSAWLKAEELAEHGMPADYADAFALGWVRGATAYVDGGGSVSLDSAPNIRCPLLILLGDKDTLNPPEYAQRTLQAAVNSPSARLLMFDAAHPIHEQQPDAFRTAILAHLRAAQP
jgi:valacyclovir hydrolase